MNTINYSEYNSLHLPIADNLICFIKGLKHAMEKTNDPEGAMHQLKCIGYNKALEAVAGVAHDYKEYHKQRIRAEYEANQPMGLEVKYPTILPARLEQYAANIQLIEQINEHDDVDALHDAIADAIAEELDLDVDDLLNAYCSRDVDAMFCAITGWELESLLAKAKIIPDAKEHFYKPGDFDLSEIAFPFYGKKSITAEEFKAYLRNEYKLGDDTMRLVQSIIRFAQASCNEEAKRTELLWAVLKEYGIPEEIVRMVRL